MSDHEGKLLREAELVACNRAMCGAPSKLSFPSFGFRSCASTSVASYQSGMDARFVVPIIQGGGNVLLFPNKFEISCGNMNECGARSKRSE